MEGNEIHDLDSARESGEHSASIPTNLAPCTCVLFSSPFPPFNLMRELGIKAIKGMIARTDTQTGRQVVRLPEVQYAPASYTYYNSCMAKNDRTKVEKTFYDTLNEFV